MNKNRLTIYGIKNCDSVRKARKWLDKHEIDHDFHDFRAEGISQNKIKIWCNALGWETVLNKRGTSFRQLSEDKKANLNMSKAIQLMTENPTLIKRPVLTTNKTTHVGFDEKTYQRLTS